MKTEIIRLIKNLIVAAIISIVVYFTYIHFFGEGKNTLTIDETPIHIDEVRPIAEISVVSYKDEVVVDSVETYNEEVDFSYYNPVDLYQMYQRNIKRRLTLIVHGEVKYGINLSDKNYSIHQNTDTVWIHLPAPKIIDVIISPSKTEIFTEKGNWTDLEQKELLEMANFKLRENAIKLKLDQKALKNTRIIFNRMMITKKHLIILFDHEK